MHARPFLPPPGCSRHARLARACGSPAPACCWHAAAELDIAGLSVTLTLPVSKADPQAQGCRRSWGCVCTPRADTWIQPCAFHAFLQHRTRLMKKGSEWLDADAPLFPNAAGLHCSKPGVVSGFRALASAMSSLAIRGQGEIGGHTARVTGARYLAALGVELAIIQLMARHASSCIMGYVRDAPLLTITGLTKAKRAARAEQDATVVQSWSEAKLKAQLDAMALRLDALAQDQQHLAGLKFNDDLLEHEETQEDPHDGELDDLTAVVNVINDKAHIA